MSENLLVCIAGKNQVAAECLIHAYTNIGSHKLLFLPSKSDGQFLDWQMSASRIAKILNVDILKTIEEIQNVKDLVFISVEYDRILKVETFQSRFLYNLHFSNLPKFRGVYTSFYPLLYKEISAGVTLHRIDSGIDTGPIIDQLIFRIPPRTRASELYTLYTRYAVELFRKNFELLVSGLTICEQSQNESNMSSFSRGSVDFSLTEIDFLCNSEDAIAKIHALTFPVFQFPTFQGQIIQAAEQFPIQTLEPNQFRYITSSAVVVGSLDNDILLILDV